MAKSLQQALDEGAQKLHAFAPEHCFEARCLLAHHLQKPNSYLFSHPEAILDPQVEQAFFASIKKRASGFPLAYILGYADFMDLRLCVNDAVLIPRNDTEALVASVLKFANKDARITCIDAGCGSGAICCAIKHYCPDWHVLGMDLSQAALNVSKANAHAHQLDIPLFRGNFLECIQSQSIDIIVSNPPYIDPKSPYLKADGLEFEPAQALIADENGLGDIKTLFQQANKVLKPKGLLFLEFGFDQIDAITNLAHKYCFESLEIQNGPYIACLKKTPHSS